MNIRKIPVYLALAGAAACGPSAPRNETPVAESRQAAYTDVTRNTITERMYPNYTCFIEATPDLHKFYCDIKSNGKGLDSVSRVHLVRPTSQDPASHDGQDRWIDGTTDYATDAFPDGFYLDGIVSIMKEPLERKSPEFTALEKGYALVQENFNKVQTK